MPKFNRDMIKGIAEQKNQNTEVRLGAGLLSEVSKKEVKMKLEHVPRNMIEKNEKNAVSINNIPELAWSIQHFGLLHPLHVKKTDDGYKLLGGERRLTAIDTLIADDTVTEWNEDSLIPVVVQNFDDIDLPLDDDMKERFAMVTSNKESRKYTDADKLIEIREWKELITALRDAGVETVEATDGDGNKKDIKIKGEKTREILAKTTNMSRGTINTFEMVENQGAAGVKEALLNKDINLSVAKQIIKGTTSKEEQQDVLDKLKEAGQPITTAAVDEKIAERKVQDAETRTGTKISLSEFKKDIKDVTALLKKEAVYLDNEEIMSYYNCIRELINILRQGE